MRAGAVLGVRAAVSALRVPAAAAVLRGPRLLRPRRHGPGARGRGGAAAGARAADQPRHQHAGGLLLPQHHQPQLQLHLHRGEYIHFYFYISNPPPLCLPGAGVRVFPQLARRAAAGGALRVDGLGARQLRARAAPHLQTVPRAGRRLQQRGESRYYRK